MTKEYRLQHDWFPRPLPANVEIGPRSWLYSAFAFVHYQSRRSTGVRVGHDTGIYNGTFFDLGPEGKVTIGDYCTIVGAIIATNGRVEVGDYAFISHEVVIADHFAAIPPGKVPFRPPTAVGANICIGQNVWIGARAILLGETCIGDDAIVGAAAVVSGTVPPGAIVGGNPAKIIGDVKSSQRRI